MAELLEQELTRLKAFVALLNEEQTQLKLGVADNLAELASQKTPLATELATFSDQRESLLLGLGLPAGKPGMERWLKSAHSSDAIRATWQSLLSLAAEARSLNDTNGELIKLHLHNNQQALNVLISAANQNVTYGPDGHQSHGPAGRSLGSA